jgi:hypothetical protein
MLGLERFNTLADERYVFFKDKLDALMLQPQVLKALAPELNGQNEAEAKRRNAEQRRQNLKLHVAISEESNMSNLLQENELMASQIE